MTTVSDVSNQLTLCRNIIKLQEAVLCAEKEMFHEEDWRDQEIILN